MLVHKGGQINNVQLMTGVGSAEMSYLQNCSVKIFKEHCRYFTKRIKKEIKKIVCVVGWVGGCVCVGGGGGGHGGCKDG